MNYNSGSRCCTNKLGSSDIGARSEEENRRHSEHVRLSDGGEAPLGINTKSASPLDPSTTPQAQYLRGLRKIRYRLQNSIRKLVIAKSPDFDPDNPDFDEYNKLPRVVKCKWTQVKPTVDINHDIAKNKAHYSNLTTCGSVWSCPICAERIQEQRRQEIHTAIEWAKDQGFQPIMLTLTTPHYEHQACADLLKKLRDSHKYLVSGKRWVAFKEKIGFQGMIRSLETLYGSSGWHSHFHILWFVGPDISTSEVQDFVLDRWEKACQKNNLIPKGKLKAFRKHSVSVQEAHNSGDYIAKMDDSKNVITWGADREIAKGLAKGRSKSLHPFQLALAWQEHGVDKAALLFMEYIAAFKGKAQIFWTHGLKDRVGLNEVSDQEASERDSEESEKVLTLETWSWQFIKSKDLRAYVLSLVETKGPDSVEDLLRENGLNSVLSHEFYRGKKKYGN